MKRSLFISLILAAAFSCTGCGRDVGQSDFSPDKSKPVISSGIIEGSKGSTSTTDNVTTTKKQDEKTTTQLTNQTTTTEKVTEAVPVGGGENVQQGTQQQQVQPQVQQQQQEQTQQQSQQSTPAPSNNSAPSPGDYNYGAAPVQYNNAGLTYIQGVLIANKSYSLPSDFNPGLDSTCENQFYKLQNAASQQGLNIWFSSGFRSYDYQAQIYNNYVARDGQAAADTYSARPGYSEHQTGLAIDVNQIDDSFIGTPEAVWLENHCHEYGFILRYPQGKQNITGYKYESWHIRYVGTDMSYAIHNSGLTLEEYFGIDSYYH
jgi:D-alanyl-D-alanine carboxypeptidase